MNDEIKRCPYCGEEININAQKCKHCGEWLNKNENNKKEINNDFARILSYAFFLGFLGIHRFLTGYKKIGIAQLVLSITLIGFPISAIWSLIDIICICLGKYKDINSDYLKNYNKKWGITICIIAILCFIKATIDFTIGYNRATVPSNQTQKHEMDTQESSSNYDIPTSNNDLEVIEHHICHDEFDNKAVCGIIQNNTDNQYSYAQININFYDKNGIQVGNSLDNANDIEPHGKLKFEVMVQGDNVSSYKIKSVEGF